MEPQDRSLFLGIAIREAAMEPLGAVGPRAPNSDPSRSFSIAGGDRVIEALAKRIQADEVGVRIENEEPKLRLGQQLLEHCPERKGLPRAGLTAEERVAVESARVQKEPHRRFDDELTNVQRRSRGLHCGEPPIHRGARGPLAPESSRSGAPRPPTKRL